MLSQKFEFAKKTITASVILLALSYLHFLVYISVKVGAE